MKKLLLALGLIFVTSSGALAQNPTCPNRPLGDSSNACANTRFVQENAGGGGTPGGTSGQIQYNNAGSFGGFTASGDATVNTSTGTVLVNKTNGVAFGPYATATSLGLPQFYAADFGVVCNGTSQSTALQTAITTVLATTAGGELMLPNCAVTLGAQVSIPNTANKGFILTGTGTGSRVINDPAFINTPMFSVGSGTSTGGVNFIFRNFSIVGASNTTAQGFTLNNANLTKFIDVNFTSLNFAVIMNNSFSVTYERCLFQLINTAGIFANTAAHHTYVHNSGFFTGGASSVFVDFTVASDSISIENSDFEVGNIAVAMAAGGTSFRFVGNYVESFTTEVISIAGSLSAPVIDSNFFFNSGPSHVMTIRNVVGGTFNNNGFFTQSVAFSNVTNMQRMLPNGHIGYEGTAPTLSSCGTSPAVAGTDNSALIITGSGATSCTITFVNAFTNNPNCILQKDNSAANMTFSISNTAITLSSATASSAYRMHCIAAPGG